MEQLKRGIVQVEVAADALKRASSRGVELDRRRQGDREAAHALRKQAKAAAERAPGDPRPPANAFVFQPGGVIVRMPRDAALDLVERDMATVEQEIRDNDREKKRALKELGDKGGVPDTVGKGLLGAFVNLRDDGGAGEDR